MQKGDLPDEDFGLSIINDSNKAFLDAQGVTTNMTKEKIDGTYKRPAHLNKDNSESIANYIIERTNKLFEEYPQMFEKDPKIKDRLF